MESIDRAALMEGCRTLLRPLASLLLKCGLTWREFAEISKGVFVGVAGEEYGLRGRPTNVSRVSILTGLGRREVGRLRRLLAEPAAPLPNKTTDATRLLSGWHQDPSFHGPGGGPADLPVAGPGPSFDELARRYAADVPPGAMLKELKRVGAVEEQPDGRLRVLRRYYMPARLDPQWVLNAGSVFADLGGNINHNLTAEHGQNSRFLGRAMNDAVDPRAVPAFRAFLEQEGQAFLERVDDWLTRHRAAPAAGIKVRLGVGLFMIQGDGNKGTAK